MEPVKTGNNSNIFLSRNIVGMRVKLIMSIHFARIFIDLLGSRICDAEFLSILSLIKEISFNNV